MGCDELIAHITRLRRKNLYIHVGQVLRLKEQKPNLFDTGYQGIETSGIVKVTKPVLIKFIWSIFIGNTRESCVIRVWESSDSIFVGSST